MPKGIFIRSEAHKQKLRDNIKKLNRLGTKASAETKRKLSIAHCAINVIKIQRRVGATNGQYRFNITNN